MSIVKKYITWKAIESSPGVFSHINPSADAAWADISLTELNLGNIFGDGRFLGWVQYDDAVVSPSLWSDCLASLSAHSGTEKSAAEALALCNVWYPHDPAYFSLDADGFTLIDGRPAPEGFP
jgi:hypothetical protein